MRMLEDITEDEMILAFIQGEADSPLRGASYAASGLQPQDWGSSADPMNPEENQRRRRALADVRGYGRNQRLWKGLPNDVDWYRGVVTVAALGEFKHLNYFTFNKLTNDSRLVRDGAKNVGTVELCENLTERIVGVSQAVRNGQRYPSLIALASEVAATPVILEGNTRACAYLRELSPEEEIEVILGISSSVDAMTFF
jgi:hypothetical protein